MSNYDIVIAGGAMAGATLALALNNLSKEELSIAVIEPYQADNGAHPGFDSRVIALSYGTRLILEKFALWSDIAPLSTAINHVHVSDKGHAGITEIDKSEHSVPALGYVVELAEIGRCYSELLSAADNIDLLCPDSVVQLTRSHDSCSVRLSSGREIHGKLLVAADGAESVCCRLLNHSEQTVNFDQVAVIANIEVSEPHDGRAFERFTGSGPLALLPMSDNRMSLVWCLAPAEAENILKLSDKAFIARLQNAFGWRLGQMTKAGQRVSYPLVLKQKEQIISHRFAAVGNAAQLLHPVAGQGFNLGIRDIAALVDNLTGGENLTTEQQDVGDYSVLSRYRQCREDDRSRTIELIAATVGVFSNDYFSLCLGRNLALMAMDNISVLKAPLVKRTMGLV